MESNIFENVTNKIISKNNGCGTAPGNLVAYFYLVSILQHVDDIVSYSAWMESVWHTH